MGDFGFLITDTLENHDGTPFDLTGYTVNFVTWQLGNPATPIINAAATVNAVPSTGGVSYTVKKTDFPQAGQWLQEWQALIGTTIVQSFPVGGNQIRVVESG
jgi:hypothetical protein